VEFRRKKGNINPKPLRETALDFVATTSRTAWETLNAKAVVKTVETEKSAEKACSSLP
jgi:hypothetical protein